MRHEYEHASAGQKSQPPQYVFSTKEYDRFQVIYVSSGGLWFSVREKDVKLGPGGVAVLRQGSEFKLYCREAGGYRGVYFSTIGDEEEDFRGQASAFVAGAELRAVAGLMEREIAAPGHGSRRILLGLGSALAWKALRAGRTAGTSTERPDYARHWAERAQQALEATVYTSRSPRAILSALPLSYRQLSRYLNEVTGYSPARYRIRARIWEAERLLRSSDLSVTATAFELGYPSSQHFAAQFRRVTGESPSAFRARIKRTPPK